MSHQVVSGGPVYDFGSDWTEFKKFLNGTYACLPYSWSDETTSYFIVAVDGNFFRTVGINKDSGSAQTDFEAVWKSSAPIHSGEPGDPRVIRKFGNASPASVSEALVSTRAYVELTSQRQCSVKSSSAQDAAAGTGAKAVRIYYLDSNYVSKTEDVTLNGTTKVNTVATDIRFIEDFRVIQGAAAAGAVALQDGTTGGAVEFCGIASGTTEAFLCHHYVPAGKQAIILGWGAEVDDEVKLKLYSQLRFGANLVDDIADLYNLMGITTPPGLLSFDRSLKGVTSPEKTYIRVTAVPNQVTATVVRATLYVMEIPSS